MTVIAWDGKELVADRLTTVGGSPLPPMHKVFRVCAPNGRVALVGFAGSTGYCTSYLNWMRGGPEPFVRQGEDPKWQILLIEHPRRVWYRCDSVNRWDLLGSMSRWSVGSGADYALGAMAAGASARKAVLITGLLDINCGLGFTAVRF